MISSRFWAARQSAVYLDKILQGATANDLPAEQPTKVGFFTKFKTAKTEGVTILPHLLTRASAVIESSGANTVTGGCYDSIKWRLAGSHVE